MPVFRVSVVTSRSKPQPRTWVLGATTDSSPPQRLLASWRFHGASQRRALPLLPGFHFLNPPLLLLCLLHCQDFPLGIQGSFLLTPCPAPLSPLQSILFTQPREFFLNHKIDHVTHLFKIQCPLHKSCSSASLMVDFQEWGGRLALPLQPSLAPKHPHL